jgi:hypothetical protein
MHEKYLPAWNWSFMFDSEYNTLYDRSAFLLNSLYPS